MLVAELHRLVPELEQALVVHDCPVLGACSLLRPDLFYDYGRAWLAIECDEGGLAHRETPGKYDTFFDALGERPILLLRVNPDEMFTRAFFPAVGEVGYQGSVRFKTMMEEVAENVKGLMQLATSDAHIRQAIHRTMLFF
jgi:hypothetical protein